MQITGYLRAYNRKLNDDEIEIININDADIVVESWFLDLRLTETIKIKDLESYLDLSNVYDSCDHKGEHIQVQNKMSMEDWLMYADGKENDIANYLNDKIKSHGNSYESRRVSLVA